MEKTSSFVKVFDEDGAQCWELHLQANYAIPTVISIPIVIAPPNRTGWSIVDVDAEMLTTRSFADEVLDIVQSHLKSVGYRLNNDHTKWRWKFFHVSQTFRMNLRAPKKSIEEEE